MGGGGTAGPVGIRLAALMVAAIALPRAVDAQVDAASRLAQVTLVARVASRASIESVSPIRETGRQGLVWEASVKVRLSTNAGYRLAVLRTPTSGGPITRMWVRAAGGGFQELAPGSSVTVAQDARPAGESEREVDYRIETENSVLELPVRYEIAVNPTI